MSGQPSQVGSHDRPGAWRRKAARWAAVFILLGYWMVYFYPVIGQGRVYMPYRYLENAGISGLKSRPRHARGLVGLPNNDCSMVLFHYPAFYFMAEGLRSGRLPLWNPYIGCGAPVDTNPQYKAFDPFMALFYLLPSLWTFWVGIGIEALFGMFGFYLFLRKLEFSPLPASIWAAFAVFNPWTQQMILLSSPWADWLLGWALLAAWWAARGRWIRTAAPAAACGLMLYCGHPEEALVLSAVTAFALAGFTSWRGGTWKSAAARTALYGLILAGFSAVYIVPFLAGLGDSVSYKALWDGVHGYAPAALLNPAKMVWFPPLLWGLVSAAFFARVKGRRFAVALILVGGLVAFKWPHLGRVRTLLALNGTLIAIYAQTLLWLGVLWLAAMATQSLMEAPRKERGRLARALIYGFALYYAFSWGYATATGSLYWPGVYVGAHHLMLAGGALLLAGLFWSRIRPAAVPAGILLLLVVTPRLYAAPYRFLVQDNPFTDPPPSVRYLQHHLPPHRRVTADFCRYRGGRLSGYTLLSPNQGVVWGLRDARLCNPSWLSTYRDLSRWWTAIDNGFTTSSFCLAGGRFLSWLGVSYVAVPHGDEAGKGMTLVFRGDPADIWKVAGHPSRARMVYSWVRCDDPYQAARLSREGLTRPQTTFRLPVGGLAGSGAPPKRVPIWNIQWLEDGMDTVRLEVRTSQAGLLFLADSDAPGWGASLDGHRTRIYRAMGAFRAVRIPAGRHLVLMKYRGNGFRTGALLTLLAILALVAALAGPPVRRAMLTRRRE